MNPDSPNPYAPPRTAPSAEVPPDPIGDALETLKAIGPVPFEGQVTGADLDEYLRSDGHVGCARLAALAIGFGAILALLPMLGMMFATIAVGLAGILAIVLTASTLPYRRMMFINANPDWADPIRGNISGEGIEVRRKHSTSEYRWNWYGEAVTSENVLTLVPATQPGTPLLITRDMMATHDAWDLIQRAGLALRREHDQEDGFERRRLENLRILRSGNRNWAAQAPKDAIPFEGIVWSDDWSRLPSAQQMRERPRRTYAVIYGLVACAGLVMAGCSGLLFDQIALLPMLVGLYVLIAIAWGRRRRARSRDVVFYLRGYASQACLATDFGLAVSETQWPGLRVVAAEQRHIVLQRIDQSNFIVIRHDMFSEESNWDRFRQLVEQQLA